MLRTVLVLTMLALPASVFAQDAGTQHLLDGLANQRNNALNAQALSEANAAVARDEILKLQGKLKEMQEELDKLRASKEPEKPQ